MNKINIILIILLALILIFLILRIILLKISKKYILKKQNIESNSYDNYLKKTIQAQKFIKSNIQFSMRGEDSNRYDSYYNKKNIKNNNNKSIFKKFNKILDLDLKNMTIDVESGVTMGSIFDYLFSLGKDKYKLRMSTDTVDMTVGGAISGIGVHFNIHDVGFFHESVVDMDVLLSDGKIVTCSSTQNKELFNSIPNTYGTIGKILRAKLKIEKTKPYVKVNVIKFNNITDFIKQMKKLSDSNKYSNICSLVYGKNELYIIVSNYVDKYKNLVTFTKYNTFYKYIKTHNEFYVKTRENMFIFESDWYWNIPDSKLLKFILPKSLRCMKFFKNIAGLGNNSSKNKHNINAFIQDWEVEYEKSFEFLTEMLDNVEPYLNAKPICIFPLVSKTDAHFYPIKKNKLYLNIGAYSQLKDNKKNYSEIFDKKLFNIDGIKMLYSVHYLNENQFNKMYNGNYYKKIKDIYDTKYKFGNLYHKTKNK